MCLCIASAIMHSSVICLTIFYNSVLCQTWTFTQHGRTQPRRWADEHSVRMTDFGQESESPQTTYTDFGNVQVKVARKGIDYLARAVDLMIQTLMQNVKLSRLINVGSLTLIDVAVSEYQVTDRSWVKLDQASGVTWHKDNVTVNLDGHLNGRMLHYRLHNASFHATLGGSESSVSLEFFERSGRFYTVFQSCSFRSKYASLQYSSVKPQHLSSFLGRYSEIILDALKARFSEEHCKWLRDCVQMFNEQTSIQNVRLPIFHADSSSFVRIADTLTKNLSPKIVRQVLQILLGLYFDASMIRNPRNILDTVNLQLSGEIWHTNGSGSLPFGPSDLADTSLVRMYDKMAYVTVSDFVINSLLYRLHEQLIFDLKFNCKESPKLASFLRFSCADNEICLSFLFPELADLYYDHSSEILFSKTENAPKLVAKPGVFVLHWEGIITLTAIWRSKPKTVLKILLSTEAELRPWFNESGSQNMLNGTVKIIRFDGRLLESAVESINQEKLDQLGLLVPTIAETLLDSVLKQGVPVPTAAAFILDHSALRILDRKFRIETDFALDPEYFTKITGEFLSSTYRVNRNSRFKKL